MCVIDIGERLPRVSVVSDAPHPAPPRTTAPSALNAPPPGGRMALGVVRRLRVVLPVAILVFVLVHQMAEALFLTRGNPLWHVGSGLLVYGLIGPLVTWRTLDWIARRLERQAVAEERARRDERLLASISSGSADAIMALDADDIVASWNRGAREILGYAESEIVGRPLGHLLPPELQRHGDLERLRSRLRERGYLRGVQARARHRDGRVVPVDLTRTILSAADGRSLGSSLILRDMTGRVEAERAIMTLNRQLEDRVTERTRQLEEATADLSAKNEALSAANAKLEQVDALKDEFVALVSHELRAPLTTIRASVELLLAAQHDGAGGEKLQLVAQEVDRLTRLVRGVLDVSRMRAGRFTISRAPVDLAALGRVAVARRGLSEAARITVHVAGDGHWALADAERLTEVIGILLDNALKYSPTESAIELSVGTVLGEHAWLAVADQGVGIPAEELDKIFERFHRVERGDARETYGHGLGLYIARQIIDAHDGQLTVTSSPGRGSTFELRLPNAPEEPQ